MRSGRTNWRGSKTSTWRRCALATVIAFTLLGGGCISTRRSAPTVEVLEGEHVRCFREAGRHEWVEGGQTNVLHVGETGPRWVVTQDGLMFLMGVE